MQLVKHQLEVGQLIPGRDRRFAAQTPQLITLPVLLDEPFGVYRQLFCLKTHQYSNLILQQFCLAMKTTWYHLII